METLLRYPVEILSFLNKPMEYHMDVKRKIIIFSSIIFAAMILSGCISIPIPTSIPIPNSYSAMGGFF
jgi:hypothetical protein